MERGIVAISMVLAVGAGIVGCKKVLAPAASDTVQKENAAEQTKLQANFLWMELRLSI